SSHRAVDWNCYGPRGRPERTDRRRGTVVDVTVASFEEMEPIHNGLATQGAHDTGRDRLGYAGNRARRPDGPALSVRSVLDQELVHRRLLIFLFAVGAGGDSKGALECAAERELRFVAGEQSELRERRIAGSQLSRGSSQPAAGDVTDRRV